MPLLAFLAPIHAGPGDLVDVEVSMFNGTYDEPVPAAAMPVLEGNPLLEQPWLFHRVDSEEINTIAMRRRIVFQLPSEAGIYDFMVHTWYFAFLPYISPFGDRFPGVLGSQGGTTNTLRFIVE